MSDITLPSRRTGRLKTLLRHAFWRAISGSPDRDFMRVDLYLVDGRIYVGELTLYPGGGFTGCVQDPLDGMLGEQWRQTVREAG